VFVACLMIKNLPNLWSEPQL